MKRLRLISFIILLCAIASVAYIRVKHGRGIDNIKPVITMEEDSLKVSVEDGPEVLLAGVTATDNKDGDVTDTLTIDNISNFQDGKRYVTIAAFDRSNNVSKAVREIEYKDYRSPHFDITEPMVFRTGETRFLAHTTANDIIDGDITGKIHFKDETDIYSDTGGSYDAVLQVKNSAGDIASLPLTIKITSGNEDLKPSVLLKHYVRYIKVNHKINYSKLVDKVQFYGRNYKPVDGEGIGEKTISWNLISIDDSAVNYQEPGMYTVTYKVTMKERDEDVVGTTELIVIVEE
ncbi:MAG: hypothetical protein Q4E53_10740 [Eubacteriales bacterium]|nr:hypothetical protein [Eubacteriales bacterium]